MRCTDQALRRANFGTQAIASITTVPAHTQRAPIAAMQFARNRTSRIPVALAIPL